MPKIRDLGISFIPATRQPEHEGMFAAGKKKPQCHGSTCEHSICPAGVTGPTGGGDCTNVSVCPAGVTGGNCTNVTGCDHSVKGGKCVGTKKPPTKKKTISRNAVEQLHAQMQQKIAHTDLTK
jgi:hypothetical protein